MKLTLQLMVSALLFCIAGAFGISAYDNSSISSDRVRYKMVLDKKLEEINKNIQSVDLSKFKEDPNSVARKEFLMFVEEIKVEVENIEKQCKELELEITKYGALAEKAIVQKDLFIKEKSVQALTPVQKTETIEKKDAKETPKTTW